MQNQEESLPIMTSHQTLLDFTVLKKQKNQKIQKNLDIMLFKHRGPSPKNQKLDPDIKDKGD